MIQYNPKSWFSLIFDRYSRYVLRLMTPLLSFIGGFTLVVCFLVLDVFKIEFEGTIAFHSILGVILGLFLVLRTNTAYDRWWEGRKLWGALVNDSRQLAIKIDTFLPKDATEDREYFRRMIPNVSFAIKEHLRDSIMIGEMDLINDEIKQKIIDSKHRPNMLNRLLYQRVVKCQKEGKLSSEHLFILDKEIKGFTDIVGACERIKTTPIPYSYSMYIKKFLFVYAITMPVTFLWQLRYWSVPVIMLAFYFLISIELIAEEIEDPFGRDINDLPLDEISVKIKSNVSEILK